MLRDEPKASPAAPSRRRVRPRRAEGESGRLLAATSRRRVAAPLRFFEMKVLAFTVFKNHVCMQASKLNMKLLTDGMVHV